MPDDGPEQRHPPLRQLAPKPKPFVLLTTSHRRCPACNRADCKSASHKGWALAREHRSKRPLQKHAPLNQIDDEKINPFARHPIKMNKEFEALYAMAWTRWNPDFPGPERHLYPKSRYSAIFKEAWHDEAMLYGVLSSFATQVSILRDGVVDQLALDLQGRVLAAQRAALAKGELSDARVITALCIMSNSYATNKDDDLSAHLKVVATWIRRRGGLDRLGMDGIVADNLMFADFVSAAVRNSKPVYTVHLPALTSTTAPEAGPAYTDLGQSRLLNSDVVSMASHYVVLMRIFDRAAKGINESSEATYFAYLANVVEYQLACTNERYHDTNTLEECVILAILIGNYTLLRNHRQLAPCVPIFEVRFWKCLDKLRDRDTFLAPGLQELEYYLVCVGTLTSVRRPSPFEKKSTVIMGDLRKGGFGGVQDFKQLCGVMDKYGWSISVCLKLFSRIWNESLDGSRSSSSD